MDKKEVSKKSSQKYRKNKVKGGYVAINKYVPVELREPLNKFINEQVSQFQEGEFPQELGPYL